jgi:CheY-like chemotaxis protein
MGGRASALLVVFTSRSAPDNVDNEVLRLSEINPVPVRRRGAKVAEILIIDDHPGDRYIMAEALAGAGHQIRHANQGAEGLALCRERLPALVVTDIVMAVKDGIETIRELRRLAPNIPILAVSGTEHADLYLNAVTLLGADAALAKPFGFDQLVQAVADLLNASLPPRLTGRRLSGTRKAASFPTPAH